MELETIKNVRKWGNSAGVLLPRQWIGKEIKVILIDRTEEINKEVFSILGPFLTDISGIYLTGSYARNEQERDSDIDVLVISKNVRKEIISGKYHISIVPIDSVKKVLEKKPILIYPRLVEAKAIMNESLQKELIQSSKIDRASFSEFIKETKGIIKINKKFLDLDAIEGESLKSEGVIYSTILRLRGMFIIKCILHNKKYTKKGFKKWILEENEGLNEEDYEKIYKAYKDIKLDKKINLNNQFKIDKIFIILNFLKKEVESYAQ